MDILHINKLKKKKHYIQTYYKNQRNKNKIKSKTKNYLVKETTKKTKHKGK
jgi:hypothetical protein